MIPAKTNLIDLEAHALDKLGWTAERRMKIYTGRQYADPLTIRAIEKRFRHLNDMTELFEATRLGWVEGEVA